MQQARLKMLQQMPIFGGLTKDSLLFLLQMSPIASVAAGDFFFREHQGGGAMYVLETGKVAVLKAWEGRDHLLAYLGAGDCFGEMEMVDLCPRAASIMAVRDCAALQISKASLFSLHSKSLEQFTLIQMNMGREICRRLRKLDQELFSINVKRRAEHGHALSHQEIIERGLAGG